MDKQIAIDDILNAKEVYFYDEDTLYIVDHGDEAYGYCKTGNGWFHKNNFWDYFESSEMLSYLSKITKEEALSIYKKWSGQEV